MLSVSKRGVATVLALGSLLASTGCSSSDAPAAASTANGVVVGPADNHCGGHYRKADYLNCHGDQDTSGDSSDSGGASSGGASSSAGNGGAPDCNFVHDVGYGDPMFNDSGDDDGCKYHMTWSATPIAKNQPFTLTVEATNLRTGEPLDTIAAQVPGKPALSRIEPAVPCEPSHHPPTEAYEAEVKQIAPGKFTVGPFSLDESGRWVIRYHFYEECVDSPTTPHAHVSFFVDVP